MLNLVIHSQFISSVWRTEVLKYCWRVTNRKPKYVIMPMILLLYSNNNCICILQYLPALYILIIFEKFLWSLLHLARILLSPCHRTWKSFFFHQYPLSIVLSTLILLALPVDTTRQTCSEKSKMWLIANIFFIHLLIASVDAPLNAFFWVEIRLV